MMIVMMMKMMMMVIFKIPKVLLISRQVLILRLIKLMKVTLRVRNSHNKGFQFSRFKQLMRVIKPQR